MLTHGSLFSGIGGFDLAAEWAGWTNLFHCEWDEWNQRVLKYYWPNSESYGDITKTDFTIWRGRIDVLSGGFPCQPYSLAGKRLGNEDERHLWPEMLRAIREIQPTWVVGENVLGLVSWNGGLVFDEVQTDLEAQGYEVQPYVLPACSVNAPHRRDRVWFVAYSKNNRCRGREDKQCTVRERELFPREQGRGSLGNQVEGCSGEWNAPNTDSSRPQGRESDRQGQGQEHDRAERHGKAWTSADTECERFQRPFCDGKSSGRFQSESTKFNSLDDATDTSSIGGGKILHDIQREQPNGQIINSFDEQTDWSKFPTQSPICNGDDGLSSRLDGITFSKWRQNSIKAGGNAIVPQVAFQIFQAINQYHSNYD